MRWHLRLLVIYCTFAEMSAARVVVAGAGSKAVNAQYLQRSPLVIPAGRAHKNTAPPKNTHRGCQNTGPHRCVPPCAPRIRCHV